VSGCWCGRSNCGSYEPEEYAQAASEGRFEADIKAAYEAGRTAERADVVAWMREAPAAGPINASQYLARAFQQIKGGAHVGAAKKGVSNG
jgi:hypothetical protein